MRVFQLQRDVFADQYRRRIQHILLGLSVPDQCIGKLLVFDASGLLRRHPEALQRPGIWLFMTGSSRSLTERKHYQ